MTPSLEIPFSQFQFQLAANNSELLTLMTYNSVMRFTVLLINGLTLSLMSALALMPSIPLLPQA